MGDSRGRGGRYPSTSRGLFLGGHSAESPARQEEGFIGSPRPFNPFYTAPARGHSYGDNPRDSPSYGRRGTGPESMPDMIIRPNIAPQKLAPGTAGRTVNLLGNFYPVSCEKGSTVYHYTVAIWKKPGLIGCKSSRPSHSTGSDTGSTTSSEEAKSSDLQRFITRSSGRIVAQLVAENPLIIDPLYVFDGVENLYQSVRINFDADQDQAEVQERSRGARHERTFTVTLPLTEQRSGTFNVKLTFSSQVHLDEVLEYYAQKKDTLSKRAVSVLEIIFRHLMGTAFAPFRRKFFDLQAASTCPRTPLVEFIQGFTTGVRMTETGLALNLHLKTSTSTCRQETPLRLVYERFTAVRPPQQADRVALREFNKYIRRLRIFTKHTASGVKCIYTIDTVTNLLPQIQTMRRATDNRSITISEYFSREYGINLERLPLIKVVGRRERYIPMELCYLSAAQLLSKEKMQTLDASPGAGGGAVQRELLTQSTHTPNVYFGKLDSLVRKISAAAPEIQDTFKVSLEPRPIALKGRILDRPKQLNAGPKDPLYKAQTAPLKWGLIVLVQEDPRQEDKMPEDAPTKEALKAFADEMLKNAARLGIAFTSQAYPLDVIPFGDVDSLGRVFHNINKLSQVELLFVGIPERHAGVLPAQIYALTKHLCDQQYGIMTHCFALSKMRSLPRGYFDTFLLKVNGKLGGANAVVDPTFLDSLPFRTDRTLFIGVDVSHPAPSEHLEASVAAAVGSLDAHFTQYTTSLRVQKKDRDEILKCLNEMVGELLIEYYKVNGAFPETVIVFRDGVSDGEFADVMNCELNLVYAAMDDVGMKVKANVVFILTQKYHHTRFALTKVAGYPSKPTWNVPSGTVVDSTIVEPFYSMFYLNSHFSPLGTSRPIKYVIMHDDLNLNADQIQKMCFLLCFNSIRTRSPLAIPTPVRYADLAAYRAKVHIEGGRLTVAGDIERRAGDTPEDVEKQIIRRLADCVNVHAKLQQRLYFC